MLAAARRVGYSGPDPVARGLRSGRAGAIGVVYDTRLTYALRDPAAGAFLSGIGECAEGDRLGLLLVPGTAPGYRDGAAGAAALLESSPRPTALIATSDELALGALDAAHERGLRVPGELSVIGFDDTPAAAAARPPLTTVHQDHDEKGRRACALLLDRIRNAPHTDDRLLPHRLVARATTGPAP